MTKIYNRAYLGDKIVSLEQANLSIASSAVLYGLSVYTVFPVIVTKAGPAAFRLEDHFERLLNSAKIIGLDTFAPAWSFERFEESVKELVKVNDLHENVFIRATVHVSELVPGTRSRGLETILSMFIYEAKPIISQTGARLKTSVWRRVPDYAIPSRAKVNGAYVNSVLGKQDALDSGYDDCLFLDTNGHVCELSAANIFIVRDGILITPSQSSDILEGINRKTVLELAGEMNIKTVERLVDLTEVYIADEVFACGTSSFIAPIVEIDGRSIGLEKIGHLTGKIKNKYEQIFRGESVDHHRWLTIFN
ncbi:MAG: aminotransferase class IV [Candidatus Vogelbacteria bacterium]|nr:aminotransferase class IV [Candidatus Vogelbacteria bacterium]